MGVYVFLTNQYLPRPGATGMCIHQLAKELVQRKNKVYTICYEDKNKCQIFDGVEIVKISTPFYLRENEKANKFLKQSKYLFSLLNKFIHFHSYPLRSWKLVKNYVTELENIIRDHDHVEIIASYTPLEAVVAAAKVKEKYGNKVEISYYSADTLSNELGESGILSMEHRRNCGIRWEEKLFSIYDKILIMECHKEHYFSEIYKPYISKMKIVNFPLFVKFEGMETQYGNSDRISFVYAGMFYRILRNPQYMCDCLLHLGAYEKIEVDILGSGDCDDIIEQAVEKSKGFLTFHGMQPHETVMEYLAKTDVLLSIGNAESPMAPSKIYEYMSTGKPIVHIYSYDKDPCLDPLKRYGNALLIKEGEENAVERIQHFLKNRKKLSYEDVKSIFLTSTPKYTVDILEKS